MANIRKKHFVDQSVQGTILLRLVLHWVLFVVTAGLFLYFVELLGGAPRNAGKNLVSRHGPTVLAVLALAPIFLNDLCKLTNRFAGPMVRLRRAMHDLAQGREVAPVHFRDRDFWKELAVDFNRVVERVQTSKNEFDDDALLLPTASIPETEKVDA
jgi:hypothetical protein